MPWSQAVTLPRYMIHFSYSGQCYNGVQLQRYTRSVQKTLQDALNAYQPQYAVRMGVSSRTDAGVHALHNTAIFHWVHRDLKLQNPSTLIKPINDHLHKNKELIHVDRIHELSPQFHLRRHCLSRTYIYRLGILDETEFTQANMEIPFLRKKNRYLLRSLTPAQCNLFDYHYLTYVEPPFNLDRFKEAMEVFQGQHNFAAFTTVLGREAMDIEKRCPVKTLKLKLLKGESLLPSPIDSTLHSKMTVYNLVIEGESFLYRLIRRITGAMVMCAQGKMTIQDILNRFDCPPDYYFNNPYPITLKPEGLFLYRVNYNEDEYLHPRMLRSDYRAEDDSELMAMEDVYEEDAEELIEDNNNDEDEDEHSRNQKQQTIIR